MSQPQIAKPFLKWAGGKSQLLSTIKDALPSVLGRREFTYIEPFVGSGAVLFWMINHFPNLKKAVINDVNADLINTYRIIASNPEELISCLDILQQEFHALDEDEEQKKAYYYQKRKLFNTRISNKHQQAALFIFLNRTCFNGLFRVNRKNEFNVPIGSYKKPTICDSVNILAVCKALQKVEILSGDYEKTLAYADNHSVFYFDPPYKPLNETSSFNAYAKNAFNDHEQLRLRDFCVTLDNLNHIWILSNSDVKSNDPANDFFEKLYCDFNIQRVMAKRRINANASTRGMLTELLITNYDDKTKSVKSV